MFFQWTEEQKAMQEVARAFAEEELAPHAASWDEQSFFPIETLRKAASLGMAGLYTAEELGGANLKRLDAVMVFEQLAEGCISTATFLSIHNMVTHMLDAHAPEALRKHWGPQLTRMQALGSYCLTEPEAGSDAASLKTKATREGEHYILNGSKAFISGATASDVYLCMVRTGDDSHKGISCVLVEKDRPGLSFGTLEHKMGWRSQPTAQLYFEDCKIPVSNRLGAEGEGFSMALKALNGGRLNIAACSLGGAQACIKKTQDYLHERKQFGKKLSDLQALRFMFADMQLQYERARCLLFNAASALDHQDPQAALYCAMAKREASEVAFHIADQALQLHGGYGYLKDYSIERIFRDLRVHRILEGTNEIMSEIIAKMTLG